MIHMNQIKIKIEELLKTVPETYIKRGVISEEEKALVKKKTAKSIGIQEKAIKDFKIIRRSLDARKKNQIYYIYQVEFFHEQEKSVLSRYEKTDAKQIEVPVVVGFGPAGMFAALTLAQKGLNPVIVERGMKISERKKCVENFWETGTLNPESNVQFGEGGAGTFSDGKLNTLIKDKSGRNRQVLQTLVSFGAPSEILYLQKPHIGTDRLSEVVSNIREEIIKLGGRFLFETKLTGFHTEAGKLVSVELKSHNKTSIMNCSRLVLAIGHSARDTFFLLKDRGILMEQKPFAMGLRVEHLQEEIGKSQYGELFQKLPAADYKLTYQTKEKRGVYSFCMCPGGYVVDSSSEPGRLVVNGMSNYLRDGKNANSAIVVTVSPEDFGGDDVLQGVEFQRKYESLAFSEASGKIPVQLFGDFLHNKTSTGYGRYEPQIKGGHSFGNLNRILPEFITDAIKEGMAAFGKKIPGFAKDDVILSGIESRTSSPIRILRDVNCESSLSGVYPCGEGAGYAGGIVSAAMDGILVAEKILCRYFSGNVLY